MNTPFMLMAGAFALVASFSITNTAFDLASQAPPRSLVLELLQYNPDNTVTQRLSGDIAASWVTRITRIENGISKHLCSGSGLAKGIYTGVSSTWTVDDWVGAQCPEVLPGDIGTAIWTYTNQFGYEVATTGRFVVEEIRE